jgi:hypothetical protein
MLKRISCYYYYSKCFAKSILFRSSLYRANLLPNFVATVAKACSRYFRSRAGPFGMTLARLELMAQRQPGFAHQPMR